MKIGDPTGSGTNWYFIMDDLGTKSRRFDSMDEAAKAGADFIDEIHASAIRQQAAIASEHRAIREQAGEPATISVPKKAGGMTVDQLALIDKKRREGGIG